jgi:hypothetical protein
LKFEKLARRLRANHQLEPIPSKNKHHAAHRLVPFGFAFLPFRYNIAFILTSGACLNAKDRFSSPNNIFCHIILRTKFAQGQSKRVSICSSSASGHWCIAKD